METHRLRIGHIEARCTALAHAAAAEQIRRGIDRVLRDSLPQALARAAEPVLDGIDGVVRIRRLSLRLDLGDRLGPADLAARLAARVAAALRAALARGDGDVRLWPDQASYLAAFILRRLGLAPGPAWPFAEFAALDHLPAERAAAELIRARPDLLGPLAREAACLGAPDAPVARWPEAARAELVLALLDPAPSRAERAAIRPALALAAPLLPSPAATETASACAAAVLHLALRACAASTAAVPPRAVVIAAAALIAAAAPRGAPGDSGARRHAPASLPGRAEAALARALGIAGRDLVRRSHLAASDARRRAEAARVADATGRDDRSARTGDATGTRRRDPARTPFAGLGLLWPSALATGVAEALGPTQLAQAVWQTLDPAEWDAAAVDPALALIFPSDVREIDFGRAQPEAPEDRAARLHPAARAVSAAAPAGLAWSALILGDLASRLRGLRGASHPWLRDQFLHRTGSVERSGDAATLRLDPVPLAVVLRMAGFHGAQMRLPIPGAPRLVIDLGDAG